MNLFIKWKKKIKVIYLLSKLVWPTIKHLANQQTRTHFYGSKTIKKLFNSLDTVWVWEWERERGEAMPPYVFVRGCCERVLCACQMLNTQQSTCRHSKIDVQACKVNELSLVQWRRIKCVIKVHIQLKLLWPFTPSITHTHTQQLSPPSEHSLGDEYNET